MACNKPQSWINGATLLGPLIIVFVALGFATDHWTDTDVDRKKIGTTMQNIASNNQEISRIYHTRHRGIIRECYPEDSALFLRDAQNVVNGDCFYMDFDDPEGMDISRDYDLRMHIMRGVLATYVLGLVGVALAFITGIILCCARSSNVAHAASICSFIGGLFVLSTIVLFHAQEYVEANKDGEPGEIIFHNNWSEKLLQATSTDLGYSYALAWVGSILAIIDGVLYLMAARALRLRLINDDGSSESSSYSDRKKVMKKRHYKEKPALDATYVYDNYGMKYATPALPQGPMFVEGHPATFMQTMPSYPTLNYGPSMYRMGSSTIEEVA